MDILIAVAAFATSLLSAIALYAGSPHCLWPALQRWHGTGSWVGLASAGLSLWLWVLSLGGGAGLCVMLGTWMLAMMALPYLALATGGTAAGRHEGEG